MVSLRVALAQINPTVGDFKGNVAKIGAAIGRAREAGADIVTFPELALCGYPPEDLLLRPQFLRDNGDALEGVVRQSEGIAVVVGFADSAEGKTYNAAAVVSNGRVVGIYHKVELPNYGVFDEKRYFSPGSECPVFEMGGVAIGVSICEDLWVEGGQAERCAVEGGVGVVLNISASPFHAGKLSVRRNIVCGFAKRTGAFVCYSNLVGGQDELVFDGGSVVVSPGGDLLASAKRFEEELLLADIEIEGVPTGASSGRSGTVSGKRIVLESFPSRRRKSIERGAAPHLGRLEEVYEGLVLGTRDYVRKNGFEKVVLGLSGGIDSSLTAAIAVDALGEGNVVGVRMPSQYTSKETFSDAALVAANLNMRMLTVPVEDIFSAYLEVLKGAFGPGQPGIENENLQARIRGNILMALSNRFGWLVLTTGNKSETAVGYCTLYGDMAGGFAVIKDVPKTLVYELAQYANEKAGRDVIPRSVFERAPSAELKPDQKDEDALPPYGVLDPILQAYVEEDRAPGEIAQGGFDSGVVDDVLRMVDGSEYKRRQAPPGIKITPKAFGRDRRLPITSRYRAGKSRE